MMKMYPSSQIYAAGIYSILKSGSHTKQNKTCRW